MTYNKWFLAIQLGLPLFEKFWKPHKATHVLVFSKKQTNHSNLILVLAGICHRIVFAIQLCLSTNVEDANMYRLYNQLCETIFKSIEMLADLE